VNPVGGLEIYFVMKGILQGDQGAGGAAPEIAADGLANAAEGKAIA